MKMSLNKIACAMLLLLVGCKAAPDETVLPFFNTPDFTPQWIGADQPEYSRIHKIPVFSFTDQDGAAVTEKTVEGKIYVANFMFTTCAGICPRMADNMKTVQNRFNNDDDILFLSHSVTPEIDSVPVLKRYAIARGIASKKWHLLTGDVKAIYAIAKKEYFAGNVIGYYGQQNSFLHTENFLLMDKLRRIRGVYNGTLPLEMERLIADIETLKKE